jgi:hypothetical protein
MFAVMIENLALALIGFYPNATFASFVIRLLDPYYVWALNAGL